MLRPYMTSFPFNYFSHILQNPFLIAFDQFIKQPQHELDRFAPASGATLCATIQFFWRLGGCADDDAPTMKGVCMN
jgi:hypothetical protein